jgi:hypothetical protein
LGPDLRSEPLPEEFECCHDLRELVLVIAPEHPRDRPIDGIRCSPDDATDERRSHPHERSSSVARVGLCLDDTELSELRDRRRDVALGEARPLRDLTDRALAMTTDVDCDRAHARAELSLREHFFGELHQLAAENKQFDPCHIRNDTSILMELGPPLAPREGQSRGDHRPRIAAVSERLIDVLGPAEENPHNREVRLRRTERLRCPLFDSLHSVDLIRCAASIRLDSHSLLCQGPGDSVVVVGGEQVQQQAADHCEHVGGTGLGLPGGRVRLGGP